MTPFTGQCFCSAVAFQVKAQSLLCGHCHCSICQRIHGSGFVTWVGCDEATVQITDKSDCLQWYQSSPPAERGRCSACGTHMFFRAEQWPGESHITRTSFQGEIDRQPSGHSFHQTHADWISVDDQLPKKEN